MVSSASGLFRFQHEEGRALVAFYDRPRLVGARLEALSEMRELFDDLDRHAFAVVHLAFPVRSLGDKLAVAVREAEEELVSRPFDEALLPLIREENGFLEFVHRVRGLPSLVLCTMAGDVDFAFLGLALACDFRIAADDTRFVNQWLRAGEPPMGAAVWFLTRYLGIGRAASLLLDTPALTAQDARRLGLVQRSVPAAELLGAGEEAARRIARLPPEAVAAMKRALIAATGDLEPYLEIEARLLQRALHFSGAVAERGEPGGDSRR